MEEEDSRSRPQMFRIKGFFVVHVVVFGCYLTEKTSIRKPFIIGKVLCIRV